MHNGRIRQAVILAAGNGARLAAASPLPKPLVPVAGRALLDHILDRLREMKVSKAYIVVGYRSGEIRDHLRNSSSGLEIELVHNPEYLLPNGISLLSVQGKIRDPFLLLMSDHLFERSTLKDLLEQQIPAQGGILATDSKIQQVFDLDDATKVESVANRIRSMGKDLTDFNAIDTGMFALTPSVFPALQRSTGNGDASLTGGIRSLAQSAIMQTWDIGDRGWIDIDTPQALDEAERLCKKGGLV